MRVTLVIDVYPPSRAGGATIYTVNLAEALVRRGVEVDVICAGSWSEGRFHFNGISQDVVNGVRVHRLFLNWRKAPAPFNYLYDNATLASIFRDLLCKLRPDVVDVNSCLTLSARIIEESLRLGLPTVVHLHDYWFLCALQNLVRKDGTVCNGPESAWGCQTCVLSGTKALRWSEHWLPEDTQKKLFTFAGRIPYLARLPGLIGMLGDMDRRQSYLRKLLVSVDAVIAPSRFLIAMFQRHGFPAETFMYSPLGFDFNWAQEVRHTVSDRVRFGYLGHLQRIKGVDVLVKAFAGLSRDVPAQLDIYGDPMQEPDYVASLRTYVHPNMFWRGPFSRDQLAGILSNLDAVVVPSICYEVCPTVIREAFAAGVPVIASDRGGVAEMIKDGINGLLFRAGDDEDLQRKLLHVIMHKELLKKLREGVPKAKTIENNVEELLALYSQLISRSTTRPLLS